MPGVNISIPQIFSFTPGPSWGTSYTMHHTSLPLILTGFLAAFTSTAMAWNQYYELPCPTPITFTPYSPSSAWAPPTYQLPVQPLIYPRMVVTPAAPLMPVQPPSPPSSKPQPENPQPTHTQTTSVQSTNTGKIRVYGTSHMIGVRYRPHGNGYMGYDGPGGGTDAPTRHFWLARVNKAIEAAKKPTLYATPCGGYNRAPAYCHLTTRQYNPILDNQ